MLDPPIQSLHGYMMLYMGATGSSTQAFPHENAKLLMPCCCQDGLKGFMRRLWVQVTWPKLMSPTS